MRENPTAKWAWGDREDDCQKNGNEEKDRRVRDMAQRPERRPAGSRLHWKRCKWGAVNEMCVRRSSGRRKSGAPYLWTARGDGGNVNSPAATTCTWRVRQGIMLANAELQDTQPAVPRSATVTQPEFDFELQGSGRSSARRHVEEASDRSSHGMHMARAARPHARQRRAAGHADCSASTR